MAIIAGSLAWPARAIAQAPPVGPLLLLVPTSPRTAALGNAWVAGRDPEVLFYNPAQIAARGGFDFSFTSHGGNGSTLGFGSAFAGGKWSLTLGWGVQLANFTTSPGVPYPYAPDVLLESGPSGGLSALVGVGGVITYKGFRIGAASKYATDRVTPAPDQIGSVNQRAWLADIGVARSLLGGVGAVSVQNLGRGTYNGAERLKLPRQLLAGWSRSRNAGPLDLGIYTQVLVRDGWVSPSGGLEVGYGWIEGYNVTLRVGGRRPDAGTEQPVSFGAAFTADRLTVEYGVQFFEGGRAANGVTIRWR